MNSDQYNPQPNTPAPGYPPQPGVYPPQPGQTSSGAGSTGSMGPYMPPSQPNPQAPYGAPGMPPLQSPYPYPPMRPTPPPGQQFGGPNLGPGQVGPGQTSPQGPQPPQMPLPPQQSPQNPMMGYNPYPYPGEFDEPKPRPKKLLIIGAIAGVFILITLIAALAVGGGNSANNTNQSGQVQNEGTTQQSSGSSKEVIARSDGKLDLSQRINPGTTLKQQSVQGKMNEQINLSSGFSFMATKVEEYASPNATAKPADGKRFIAITTVVGNRADSNISVSYLDFRLRDSNDTLIAPHVATNEILNNPLSSPTELKPGEQLTGRVVFEVNNQDMEWVFKHSETYQKTTDNTTFTVEGEIVVRAQP